LILPVPGAEPTLNSVLAVPQNLGVVSFHSKWPFVGGYGRRDKRISTNIYGHFELFLFSASKNHA
jgi:hypothetical protein